jgi:hypothetical protein
MRCNWFQSKHQREKDEAEISRIRRNHGDNAKYVTNDRIGSDEFPRVTGNIGSGLPGNCEACGIQSVGNY